jgi:uncharacterized protein (TIGR00730 family)
MKNICVFCGSQPGDDLNLVSEAADLGRSIVRLGFGLVFGGGRLGLMGAVAEAALAHKGHVIGIIPKGLTSQEPVEQGLSELFVVDDLSERKRLMIDKSSAFVVLPGGIGTFDELFEIWTGKQVGVYPQPMIIANWNNYYDRLLEFLKEADDRGFIRGEYLKHVIVTHTLHETIEQLKAI